MIKYQQKIWFDLIKNRIMLRNTATNHENTILYIISRATEEKILLNKNNLIFNHNTSKEQDSYLLDYIHGNSYIFGNIRRSRGKFEMGGANCYFCQSQKDSPWHQLYQCKELKDMTHGELKTVIHESTEVGLFALESLSQEVLIKRVTFLMGQHKFLQEEDD